MSSSKARFRVRAKIRGRAVPDVQLILFDGFDREVTRVQSELDLEGLPRGLYTVRLERAGLSAEQDFRHDTGTDAIMAAPERSSSVPSFDTVATHEYYAYTSQEWSVKKTHQAIGEGQASGRLFLFVRMIEAQRFKGQDLAANLSLRDRQDRVLSRFEPDQTERGGAGWLAFSADAAPGRYLLRYEGEPRRELALDVAKGFTTQLFITFDDGLAWNSAMVLMPRREQGFHPDDHVAQAVDIALAGLQRGRINLPSELTESLLAGKFDNPMLGLVGAHLELLRPEAEKSRFSIILQNLRYLTPNLPDVAALEVAVALRFGAEPPSRPIADPPMLRVGLDAVLRASADHADLVPEDSKTEAIMLRQYVDSPLSSWEPEETEKTTEDRPTPGSRAAPSMPSSIPDTLGPMIAGSDRGGLGEVLDGLGSIFGGIAKGLDSLRDFSSRRGEDSSAAEITTESTKSRSDQDLDWVVDLLRRARQAETRRGRKHDLKSLARQAGLPTRVLERAERLLDEIGE